LKGNFGLLPSDEGHHNASELLIQTCRQYLSSSMQYALLNMEAKRLKTARQIFNDIIDLEGAESLSPMTNARCRLMRMYLDANRPDSARRLWERLPSDYSSVWIRYSAALMEFVSWKVLNENGSTQETATKLLAQAIRSNVFCALYISFHDTFQQVMEYTDDVEDAEDGSLEQAIEYCNSEQMGNWLGSDGAVEWIREEVLRALNSHVAEEDILHEDLSRNDLEWESRLGFLESQFDNERQNSLFSSETNQESLRNPEEEEEVDTIMFAGMFRTCMDMLSDAGRLNRN
jgi:hypothetical protein